MRAKHVMCHIKADLCKCDAKTLFIWLSLSFKKIHYLQCNYMFCTYNIEYILLNPSYCYLLCKLGCVYAMSFTQLVLYLHKQRSSKHPLRQWDLEREVKQDVHDSESHRKRVCVPASRADLEEHFYKRWTFKSNKDIHWLQKRLKEIWRRHMVSLFFLFICQLYKNNPPYCVMPFLQL